MIQYRHKFFEFTSSADNATWNKTGFFENVKIDIPSYPEQLQVIKEYDNLEMLEEKLKQSITRIDHLNEVELSVPAL